MGQMEEVALPFDQPLIQVLLMRQVIGPSLFQGWVDGCIVINAGGFGRSVGTTTTRTRSNPNHNFDSRDRRTRACHWRRRCKECSAPTPVWRI